VHRVRPDLQGDNGWILHQDNAPSHTALIVCEFLACNLITVMDHPPYSPNLAPCDFFFFPKCKLVLCGRHLGDMATITAESTMLLKGLKEEDFQECFNQQKRRWAKCLAPEGDKSGESRFVKQHNLYDLAGNLPPPRWNLKNVPDIQNFWMQKNWMK
jgi:hypothetical protein